MNAPVRSLWLTWLRILSATIVLTGFCFAYVFTFLVPEVQQLFFGEITGGELASLPDAEIRYHNLLLSVLGGVMMGWGVMWLFLCRQLKSNNSDWIWSTLAISFAAWFVFDTVGSVLAGSLTNVGLNCIFLIVALPPLIANRQSVIKGLRG